MNTLLIDFEALATNPSKALRRVVQIFTRAGLQVVDAVSDGKTKRSASVKYREATINLSDGQAVTLRVKESGDIGQVQINGKLVPIAAQDDPARAVQEIVAKLDAGRAAFQKRQAALQMKPPEGIKTAAPKLEATLVEQIAEVDAAIEGARKELSDLTGVPLEQVPTPPSFASGNSPAGA